MTAFRYLTLAWPGLPWLWLRGSRGGLVLALAFAVSLDVAVITTFVWPDLVELPITVAVWTATAVVWLVSTVSALAAFPPRLATPAPAAVDPLFVKARDAYLARDFIVAETRLRELLELAPTDGEAQLLLATLLRRAGRLVEARDALEKLSASDAGIRWRAAIAAERTRIAAAARGEKRAEEPATLPVADEIAAAASGPVVRSRAA
jgi:thioredoxin-like negative regulator of GroEL